MQTATRARDLANQELAQARDRFAAGIVSNLEVVQAQETVALANSQYIEALYGFGLAKAFLAGSLGSAEEQIAEFFGGAR